MADDPRGRLLAMTLHIMVTVSAGTPTYAVLEQRPQGNAASGQSNPRNSQSLNINADALRQLLRLKRELFSSRANNQ